MQGSVKGSQVVDGQVYILVQKSGDAAFYGQMSLYAVDAGTGQARWEFPRNPTDTFSESMLLGVGNGLLYVLSNEGPYSGVPPYQLYVLSTDDGSVRWHALSEPGHILALYNNGVIYVGMDNAIAAYRASDGQRLWNNSDVLNAFPTLVAQGVLYLYNADTSVGAADIFAVDAGTGKMLWQYASGKPMLVRAVANGLVYAITQDDGPLVDNTIYALDAANGAVRWTHDIGHDKTYYLIAR